MSIRNHDTLRSSPISRPDLLLPLNIARVPPHAPNTRLRNPSRAVTPASHTLDPAREVLERASGFRTDPVSRLQWLGGDVWRRIRVKDIALGAVAAGGKVMELADGAKPISRLHDLLLSDLLGFGFRLDLPNQNGKMLN